jgi:hypothetical protein
MLLFQSNARGALLVMAHPDRSAAQSQCPKFGLSADLKASIFPRKVVHD